MKIRRRRYRYSLPRNHVLKPFFLLVLFLVGAAFIGRGVVSLSPQLLSATKISCVTTNNYPCREEISLWLHQFYGQSLLLSQPTLIKRDLLLHFPYLDDAIINITLPHTMGVTVSQAKGKVALNYPASQQTLVLTANGTVVPEASAVGLPSLEMNSTYHGIIGEPHQLIIDAITLVDELHKNGISYQKLVIDDNQQQYAVYLTNGYKALFTSSEEISRQVATLQAILGTATMNPERPIIDLRFNKPVLKPEINVNSASASGTSGLKE